MTKEDQKEPSPTENKAFTPGNLVNLSVLILFFWAAVGAWYDMRGSVQALGKRQDTDREALQSQISFQKTQRDLQFLVYEGRIAPLEKMAIDAGQLTKTVTELRVEVNNLTGVILELKAELRAQRDKESKRGD